MGLVGCGHGPSTAPVEYVPFDQILSEVSALHNSLQLEGLKTHFTKDATIQSPLTPRGAGIDQYLSALKAEPYNLTFSKTEVVYSLSGQAATRSEASANSPGRFQLKERVTVDWKLEKGNWLISRVVFSEWPAVVGTWRRSGPKREGSIELRIQPGGKYVIYTAEDYSAPAFRGIYTLEGNRITLEDTSAFEAKLFSGGQGSYMFLRTPHGLQLTKVQDENPWRSERFEGEWSSAH
ncbi:hypothetical protein BH09VER1_BH09VER1_45470 [soil metagenome]